MSLNIIKFHPLSDDVKILFVVKELDVLHDVFLCIFTLFTQLLQQADVGDLARHCSLAFPKDNFDCYVSVCALMYRFHDTACVGVLTQYLVLP